MKLSTRKELLKESEITLKSIKKSLNEAADRSKLDAVGRLRKDYIRSFNNFMQVGETNEDKAETIWNSFLSDLNKEYKGKTIGDVGIFTPSASSVGSSAEIEKATIISIRTGSVQFSYRQGGNVSIVDYGYKPYIVCRGSVLIQLPGGTKRPLDIVYNGGKNIFLKKKSS